MSTIVYKYGLRPPTTNAKRVLEQQWLAHRYRNILTELELTRREAVRQAQAKYPDLIPLQERSDELKEVVAEQEAIIKLYKARNRTQKVPKELRNELSQLKKKRKDANEELKAMKKIANKDLEVKAQMDAAQESFDQQQKEHRAKCGCFWGTYLLTERAAEQARGEGKEGGAPPPKFVHWKGEGQVGVQIQKGMSVSRLFSGIDTRIQIDPVPDTAWDKRRSKEQRTSVRIHVGSKCRSPIWAEWPVTLHRPLPAEAKIKWAQILRNRIAGKDRCSLHLTLDVQDPAWATVPEEAGSRLTYTHTRRLRRAGPR